MTAKCDKKLKLMPEASHKGKERVMSEEVPANASEDSLTTLQRDLKAALFTPAQSSEIRDLVGRYIKQQNQAPCSSSGYACSSSAQ